MEYKLAYENKVVYFMHEKDYLERLDYINNGLKITSKSNEAYHFNDGALVFIVTILKDNSKLAVLHKVNRVIKDKRQTKKYVELIDAFAGRV